MQSIRRLLAAGVVTVVFCQLSTAATLTGRVRDANNKSFVLGAAVSIRELNRETITDREGEFTVGDIPAGTYTVVASYLGYGDVTQTITVSDQTPTRVELTVGSEIIQLGAIIVGGEREGQARALQQKRTADNILDVVAADSMGKLPDGNAAEAVRHLPGVFAEIDQNEGPYIVVRGIDANLKTSRSMGFGRLHRIDWPRCRDGFGAGRFDQPDRSREGGHARHGSSGDRRLGEYRDAQRLRS